MTVPTSTDVLPDFDNYDMHGRTYKYMEAADILFPFGYGLSYGQVQYDEPSMADDKNVFDLKLIKKGKQQPVRMQAKVGTDGTQPVYETMQLYACAPGSAVGEGTEVGSVANSQLIAFRKVLVKPGEPQTVTFEVRPEDLMTVQDDGTKALVKGVHTLYLGASAPGACASKLDVSIVGQEVVVK